MTEAVWAGDSMRSLVEQVRQAAGLSSFEESDALVRATLATLAESISAGQFDALARGLPKEVRTELSGRGGQARAIDERGFLDRVSGSIQATDLETTEQQVRAVLTTVRSWAPEGEVSDTVEQLPRSLRKLFK